MHHLKIKHHVVHFIVGTDGQLPLVPNMVRRTGNDCMPLDTDVAGNITIQHHLMQLLADQHLDLLRPADIFTKRVFQRSATLSQLDYRLVSDHLRGTARVVNDKAWSGKDHFVVTWQPDNHAPIYVKKKQRTTNTGWALAGDSAQQDYAESVMTALGLKGNYPHDFDQHVCLSEVESAIEQSAKWHCTVQRLRESVITVKFWKC